LINNPKLFFSLLAFTFSGLKSTIFSIDKLKSEFHSIVFIQQKAIFKHAQNKLVFSKITWKQKQYIRKYLKGIVQLFGSLSKDAFNLEKEDCILLFNYFLELFFEVLKTVFADLLLSFGEKIFYGVDKFIRHFNCRDSIQKLHIKLISFFSEMIKLTL